MTSRRVGCIAIAVFFVIFAVCAGPAFIQIPILLVFGSIGFLFRTIPQMTVEPAAFVVAGGSLVAASLLTHGLARWLYGCRQVQEPATEPPVWRFRWTAGVVSLVLLMFVAGIAFIVTVHQLGWLAFSDQPMITMGGEAPYRATSVNNLKQIGLGVHIYLDARHQFPPGGTFNEFGEPLHSWETMLLPYLDQAELWDKIDKKIPWNQAPNAPLFQTANGPFMNPQVVRDNRDAKLNASGYGLSHYALNSRVGWANSRLRLEDVKDGTANTILGGEVNANFKPWGDPVNWRDPALGLNRSPDGFGATWHGKGVNMLMLDGGVRHVSEDIDPAVLKALSTPAGGEKIPDDWWEK